MAPPKRGARQAPLILQNNERHYPLRELAKMLPDRPHPDSLRRWCRDGVQTIDTTDVVKMETIWGTHRRCRRSSVEAYNRFIDLINGYEREAS